MWIKKCEIYIKCWLLNIKGKDYMGNLAVDGRQVLKQKGLLKWMTVYSNVT
jgi:hypothetical protein